MKTAITVGGIGKGRLEPRIAELVARLAAEAVARRSRFGTSGNANETQFQNSGTGSPPVKFDVVRRP